MQTSIKSYNHICMKAEDFELFWEIMGWTPNWVGSAVIQVNEYWYTYYKGVICLVH